MAGSYLIGIDVGTTNCKASIFDLDGREVGFAVEEYPIHIPKTGWAEQDPNDWVEAAIAALRGAIKRAKIHSRDVVALGLTGQQSSIVLIDARGKSLHPSILWMDRRTVSQCDDIRRLVGEDRIYQITGLRIDPIYSVAKLLWIKDNAPQILCQTHKMLLPKDYLVYKFTGNVCVDYANAASTQLLDIGMKTWSDELLEILNIPRTILPTLCAPTDVVGELSNTMAIRTGLRRGIPVVSGGGDTTVSALGTGVSASNSAAIIIGTASDVVICMDELILDPHKRVGYYPHVVPHKHIFIAGANTSGMALRWFRNQFYSTEMETAQLLNIRTYSIMDAEAESLDSGSGGLIFLPYLMGERSPIWNPIARGLFFGITLRHKREHFVRAIMEGIAFSIKHRIEVANELGINISDLILGGGGSKSRVWSQIIADVLSTPISVPTIEETTCLGAALLAGLGIGIYRDYAALREIIMTDAVTFEPRNAHLQRYRNLFSAYKQLYSRTAPLLSLLEGE